MQGRTALVCASTSGLGWATAEALSAEGAGVVVCGRRGELARELAARLPRAVGVTVDLLDPSGPATLVDATVAHFGEPDIVVLNGPGPRPARVTGVDERDLGTALDTLLTAHHRLLSLVLPGMRCRGWGRVLAIGSSAVVSPIDDLALSGIGRSALASYLKMLATEIAPDGVTVNLLLPGRMNTERMRQVDVSRMSVSAHIPAGRTGSPAEFGAVAAFLCGEPSSYITGTAVRCDGGMLAVL